MLVILKLQSDSRNLFLWFSFSPLLPLSPVGLHLFQPFTQISIFIFSHFHAYNTFHFLSPPLFLLLLTPWRRALCSAPPLHSCYNPAIYDCPSVASRSVLQRACANPSNTERRSPSLELCGGDPGRCFTEWSAAPENRVSALTSNNALRVVY